MYTLKPLPFEMFSLEPFFDTTKFITRNIPQRSIHEKNAHINLVKHTYILQIIQPTKDTELRERNNSCFE